MNASRPASRRVLVRGVNWLGDAVMTTPALQRLREALPGASVTLLTDEKLADLWTYHPSVDEVLQFKSGDSVVSVARQIRECKFDVALVFPNSPRSAVEVWLGRVPERIGYARPWRNWFLTRRLQHRPGAVRMHKRSAREIRQLISLSNRTSNAGNLPAAAHHVHEYLYLIGALGGNTSPLAPLINVTREETKSAIERFGWRNDLPWFGLNAGAEYGPAKRWPLERFIDSAVEIGKRIKCRWVVFGGPGEATLGAEIVEGISSRAIRGEGAAAVDVLNLAGKTSLRHLCVLLKLCRVLLTNDSGPMHLAAAVGTPVVAPFGSTSPELTGPGLPGPNAHRILRAPAPCSPCFRRVCPIDLRCLTGITEHQVVEAVIQIAATTA